MKFLNSSILLFSAVAVVVQCQSIVVSSKAIFTGVDNSDLGASAVKVFFDPNNHATATASFIEILSKQTGFRPNEHGLYTTNDQFLAFKMNIKEFEYFEHMDGLYLPMKLTGDLDQLKHEVAREYAPLSRYSPTEILRDHPRGQTSWLLHS
ncbi:MAG: hypothetical protein J3Q66DRAFT_358542 [Benniella sp.]|nr:MAG: hypothetical protein J3Q66DRAFT_358542 [Benniella sp.]